MAFCYVGNLWIAITRITRSLDKIMEMWGTEKFQYAEYENNIDAIVDTDIWLLQREEWAWDIRYF